MSDAPILTLEKPKRSPEPAEGAPPDLAARDVRVDVQGLWAALRRSVEGEVRFDRGTRGLYAQDASNYYHVPLGVVLPRTKDDVIATIAACRAFGAPVLARGGGTGLAGQTCNEAVVLDFSRHMRRIVALDPARRQARIELGLVCDELVAAAAPSKLTFGPKPATHSHCCFGGMLANNCGGMHAQYAGIGVANTLAMEVLLYDGTRMELGSMDEGELAQAIARGGRAGEVYARLRALRDRHARRIREGFPKLPRRVSGYNLDQLLPGPDGRFNLARALVGSEGTCVTMLEATVRLVDLRPERVLVVAGYADVYAAGDHVPDVLAADVDPMAVEGMDQRLIDHFRRRGGPGTRYLDLLPAGHGWLLVEIGADDADAAAAAGERLMAHLRRAGGVEGMSMLRDREEQREMLAMRESGLGATAFIPGEPDNWPGWEDSAVRPEDVGPYLRDLRALFDRHGLDAALYGHFGMGCIHCRISFDLVTAAGVANYRRFMNDAADLVTRKYHGSLSGEHGDGQSRAELLVKMFGPELVGAFREFKAIWDPDGKMNPGKIVDPYPMTANLRLGPSYDPKVPRTHFAFARDQGSFARATLRCAGVGKCRRLSTEGDQGVMCPSFLVTEEERHSTRGRAHLLWEMMRGPGPIEQRWHNEEVKESLDLCLACKGCKNDCPVNVDMATYKAEFLSHYYEGHLRPRHAFAFGWIDKWSRLASLAPGVANLLTEAPGTSRLAKWAANVHPDRTIPAFAPQTFRSWFRQNRRPVGPGPDTVLLFSDTFNDHFHPETAQAAVEVLEHLGFAVAIPRERVCCGRPLYDFGMLDQARRYLERGIGRLEPFLSAGTPMIVLEPSCCSVFRDEMTGLMPAREAAIRLRKQTFSLSEFLLRHADRLPRLAGKAVVQGHCHDKSVLDFQAEKKVLEHMGVRAEALDSSCCGMAGSFGFEKDKYAVSQACGERVLLPAVRAAAPSTLVVADGFSCRTQIAQGTQRHALHLAQVVRLAMEPAREAARDAGTVPIEAPILRARLAAIRRSKRRAAVGIGVVGVALGLLWWRASRR